MDLLVVGLLSLATFALGIIGNLVASEFYDRAPNLAAWLIARAVRQLPEPDRARYLEEWRGHLEECPGKLGKLWHALGCCFGATKLGTELSVLALKRAGAGVDDIAMPTAVPWWQVGTFFLLTMAFVLGVIFLDAATRVTRPALLICAACILAFGLSLLFRVGKRLYCHLLLWRRQRHD
jgi:hypothetical protein